MLFSDTTVLRERKSSALSIVRDLWKFMRPLHASIYGAMVLIFISQLFVILLPFFWKQMIDGVIQKESLERMFILLLVLLAFTLFQAFLTYVRQIQAHHLRWKTRLHLEEDGFKKLLSFSIGQHTEQASGIKFTTYQNGVSGFTNMLQQLLFDVFPAFFVLTCTLVFLLFVSWELALLLLFTVVLRLYTDIRYARKYVKQPMKKMITQINKRWSHMKEVAREIETVKQFGREEYEHVWLQEKFKSLQKLSNSIWLPSMRQNTIRHFLFQVGYYAILFLGIYFIFTGRFTPGYMLLFISWGNTVIGAVRDLTNFERDFIDHLVNAEKLLEMLRKEPVVKDALETKLPTTLKGAVEFQNVGFAYHENSDQKDSSKNRSERMLFEDLHLDFPAGKTTALVGHSGSGKSTIIKLLQRYYDVTSGEVLLDGINIKEVPLHFLKKQLGIVPQDVRLFDGSLRKNLLYGVEDSAKISDEVIERAMKMSCIDKFFDRLPYGLETEIGENGVRLSGGERQRVGIARALLKDPSILIFDEATSSLDAENEKLIQESIRIASQGRTTIIIAHRLSTIIHADKIIVLEKGRVVGEGTHRVLMSTCPEYAGLVKTQMRDVLTAQVGEIGEESVDEILRELKIL